MKRGKKPRPCPNYDELRRLAAADPRPAVVARQFGCNVKQARRWMGEIGIQLQPPRKHRPAGVTPRWVVCAHRSSDGKRVTCALHNAWSNMKRRTRTDHPAYYRWYKAKGITFCAEWNEYVPFRAWAIANGFRKGLWLDRIDGSGNYEPTNCRWTTRDEQMLNMSAVHRLTLNGVTKPLPVWARELGMSLDILRSRVNQGWTDEQVLTTPRLSNGYYRQGVQHKPRGRAAQKARIARESAN